jgi:leader peptidase (prepilin peptidase)/N-methyltransferase
MTRRAWVFAAAGLLLFTVIGLARGGDDLLLARLALLGPVLGAIVAYDLCERRIPNTLVLPATAGCLPLVVFERARLGAVAPALGIAAVLLLLSLARPAAIGMGDAKLTLLIATALPADAVTALLAGYALAAATGGALVLSQRLPMRDTAIPLAPFLTAGALLSLFA